MEYESPQQNVVYKASNTSYEIVYNYNYMNTSSLPNKWMTKCSPQYDNERELFQNLQMDAYNTLGVPSNYYSVSYNQSYDKVFGEDNDRYVTYYWRDISLWFDLPKDNKMWNKFAFLDLNQIMMYCSKKHFDYVTSGYIPQIGDIIQSEYDSKIYEITEVKEDDAMYFQSQQYTWTFYVTPFTLENLTLSGSVSASPLSAYNNLPNDIYDATNPIDVEKSKYIYKSGQTEKPKNDPFSNW